MTPSDLPLESDSRPPPGLKDLAWMAFAGISALLFGANVVAVFVLIAATEFSRLLVAPVSLLVIYWFMVGAFRRTTWGYDDSRAAPPDPPVLSERTARTYAFVAIGCALALVIATAAQLLVARSS